MARNTIDSNIVSFHYAREVDGSPGQLPTTPDWKPLAINSYNDFGQSIETVVRDPISGNRQNQKGTIVDADTTAGFEIDLTATNLLEMLQGFFFADAREKPTTNPLNGIEIPITNVDAGSGQYQAASGLTAFGSDSLIFASGFQNAANNGLKKVTSVTATDLTVSQTLLDETPSGDTKVITVGHEFPLDDAELSVVGNQLRLLSGGLVDFTTLNLNIGEFIWIGGDATVNRPDTSPSGFARIAVIETDRLIFDQVTATFVTDALIGKSLHIFFGTYIRNEEQALIKRHTYSLERQLGEDDNGIQSEYVDGALPNTFSIDATQGSKLTASLEFLARGEERRDGSEGVKSGNRFSLKRESAYNTSTALNRVKLNELDPTTLEPTGSFAFVTDLSLTINNNASAVKAIGTIGAIDVVLGNFVTNGEVTAYFQTHGAKDSIALNADVEFNAIFAQLNTGFIFDMPLLSLGNGIVTVTKDEPITLPLTLDGAENKNGYTLSYGNFEYLPDSAM